MHKFGEKKLNMNINYITIILLLYNHIKHPKDSLILFFNQFKIYIRNKS